MDKQQLDTPADRYREKLAGDQAALRAYDTLLTRGSLAHLSPEGFDALTAEIIHWLVRAESHAGSELVYLTEEGKVRGLPIGSFFDFPERYAARMQAGAYISAEMAGGGSVVLFTQSGEREQVLAQLEAAQQALPLTTDRPLRERIQEKLRQDGHLSCLSAEGLGLLDAKLIKYLDYAVNVRPGSEMIYVLDSGEVKTEPLENVMRQPDAFAEIPRPVFLAIDIDEQSVLFDTHDLSPANLWRMQKKARQVVAARQQEN